MSIFTLPCKVLTVMLTTFLFAASRAASQVTPQEMFFTADPTAAYLSERSLNSVLAARLREELRTAAPADAKIFAEALGRVYARMLDASKGVEERLEIEAHCKQLLERMPDVESFELRLDLAQSAYLTVENNAENKRLLLTTPEQDAETVRVLRAASLQFAMLSAKLTAEFERAQRRVDSANDRDMDQLKRKLEEVRHHRSRAAYFAGWSMYYLAYLDSDPSQAEKAMEQFGVILNAVQGKPASIERVSKSYMNLSHYARSALGCAMCASLMGRHVEATRWIDIVDQSEDVTPEVMQQVFRRRLIVLAAAQRWADIDVHVRQQRSREELEQKRLNKAEARLLAVLALESSTNPATMQRTRDLSGALAQIALSDLVSMGEVSHVNDLFRRFGTAPIAERGFIAGYLRSLDEYEKIQARQLAEEGTAEEPSTNPEIVLGYQAVARLFDGAIKSEDAGTFPSELSRALVRRGLSLFRAGDFEEAADQFEDASSRAAQPEDRRESLWFAIVSLDRAVLSGRVSLKARCDQLAALLVKQYPGSDRAVSLLPRLVKSSLVSGDEAIESLLQIPEDSPLYLTARSEAVRYLYAKFGQSKGSERDFLANRVADVGEEVIRLYHAKATASQDAEAKDAAERLSVRARQVADVLLSTTVPDATRAAAAIEVIESTAEFHGAPLGDLEAELAYHRFRIELINGNEDAASTQQTRIRIIAAQSPNAARFAFLCDRARFLRAVEQWKASENNLAIAQQVIQSGLVILARGSASENPQWVRERVCEAAFAIWDEQRGVEHEKLILELDAKSLAVARTAASLRRVAIVSDAIGNTQESMKAWNEILDGLENSSPLWHEARFETLRILAASDPQAAAVALQQHRVLHPDLGPEPWRTKFEELDRVLPDVAPAGNPKRGGPK